MKYSNKEKLSIVARCQQGESIATLSNELAIPLLAACDNG